MSEGKNLSAILESILFVHGEPMTLKHLCAIADADEEIVKAALAGLTQNLEGRGIMLIEKGGSWQLGSHPLYAKYVEALARGEFGDELSRAAMETMAVIAYKGPISRAGIEYIRGVNSSFTLRALLMRGLIERVDNPKDTRAYLYRTSIEFLKHFGLARAEDLPRWRELSQEAVGEPVLSESTVNALL